MEHPQPRDARFYTVYPADPENETSVSETKAFLQSVADGDVLDNRSGEKTVSWRASLKNETLIESVKEHEGVRLLEPEDSPLGLRSVAKREEEEPKTWMLLLKDPYNKEVANDIRRWLEARVKDMDILPMPTTLRPGEDPSERGVMGFGSLHLDDADREEAKKLPGVIGPMENRRVQSLEAAKNASPGELRSLVPREEPELTTWIALLKDPYNRDEVNKTREWLEGNVKNKTWIQPMLTVPKEGEDRSDRGIEGFGYLLLDDESRKEAEKQPGISRIVENAKLSFFRAVSSTTRSESGRSERRGNNVERAALEWAKQEKAAKDLVMDSLYQGGPTGSEDFVYKKGAGKGTTIFVVDTGVNVYVKNAQGEDEFPHYDYEKLFITAHCEAIGQFPWGDDYQKWPTAGHGTFVASKALGKTHGVAKEALLIPVKIHEEVQDLDEALDKILEEIKNGPESSKDSVVSISLGVQPCDPQLEGRIRNFVTDILARGVPIVLASGNADGAPDISAAPQRFEGPDLPLINVGAATLDGDVWHKSQGGPQLTLYAPGKDVTAQSKKNGEVHDVAGTSFAAPVVSGIIATYMSYDEPPWGKMERNLDRVKAIKKFIQTDRSSWERKPGVNMIWNGADKQAHESVGAHLCQRDGEDCESEPAPPPAPEPAPEPVGVTSKTCNGIDNNRYIVAETIGALIDYSFCPDAVTQGRHDDNTQSIKRTYLQGTSEQVDLAIDWSPSLDWKPNLDDCKKYMRQLIDECDVGTHVIPWRGGGNIHVGKEDVVYRWNPTTLRQKAMDKPWGHCHKSLKFGYEKYTITGAGWLNSGFGHELHDRIESKNLQPTGWDFRYGLNEDGREWTLWVQTLIGSEPRVQNAIREVANFPDFGLNC